MTDTGASAQSFVDPRLVKEHKLPTIPLKKRIKLRLADHQTVSEITHMAQVKFSLGTHTDELWCLIT